MTPTTFVIAGGGTGGHVLPALAVARVLREHGHFIQFIGVRRGIEARLIPAENFPIEWIHIGGLNRVGFRKTLRSLFEIPGSVWRSIKLLKQFRPAAVFSTGGYVAGPVLLAAIFTSIPIVVMEPNAIPGFTHRRLARFVQRALVAFPESAIWFPPGRAEVTGMPIRAEFFSVPPKPRGSMIAVLITGGSQGSAALNRAARESWPLWERSALKGKICLLHQTGSKMFLEFQKEFAATGLLGEVSEFITDMPRAFSQSDLVVSRSGMGTLSELAAAGKPAILVPFPDASDDHQLKNAEAFRQAGAATVVLDRGLTGQTLVDEIVRIVSEPGLLERMSQAARAVAKPGAAERAAQVLEYLASRSQGKSVA